ncbi:thiol disulfide exchange, putative role in cytochrome c biogenesis [Alkalihalophilus pseudofirmus OF4]|uniref:Thiol disulfide exchange, putative role in cytochrome c biogenesis n=1 Tax=Alkalihalophilus pseudofirmus (strain ATCC BAA-2126 / JCM 17055 / OF4) TaxID=398511 RepID=D3FXX2_ALKPO|nr:redoxin domain-containing protein [Alkalihalophilus pseudofirmus]ADC50731.1 thiol disulfide exchange, putative role in cytochrome c biogenesis [Alkalihalophilus pseudofirmus OF4]
MRAKLVLLIMTGFLAFGVFDSITSESSLSKEKTGDGGSGYAPDFTLETLTGDKLSLSDFRGEPVMINFWATWCPPCRAEMPDMERFYQETDIIILAVNQTGSEASVAGVQSFTDELNLTFPILLDEKGEAASLYSVQPLPTSVFINRDGEVHHVQVGAMNKEMMERVLAEL